MNNPEKLAFSTTCLPGSIADQKEAERLAEFQRSKALRQAEELFHKPEEDAKRHQAYLLACQANREKMNKSRSASRQ